MRQPSVYKVIQKCHELYGYPIEMSCKLLHVARSAYHKWASGKLSQRTLENQRLAEKIEHIHSQNPDKGYRRINDDLLHDHGIHVNDKRVLRICRVKDIKSTIQVCESRVYQAGEKSSICRGELAGPPIPCGQAKRKVAYRCNRIQVVRRCCRSQNLSQRDFRPV